MADIVLTSSSLHRKYEIILSEKGPSGKNYGKALEAEAFIRALMKTIQDLIHLDVLEVKKINIEEALINNLGEEKGREIYMKWTSGKDFNENLIEFNKRRIFAQKGDYNSFLTQKYPETWEKRSLNAEQYISKAKSKYALFFSYQADKDILFEIFPSRIFIP